MLALRSRSLSPGGVTTASRPSDLLGHIKMKCVPVSSPPTYDVKGSILYGEAKGGGLLQSSIGWMAVGCRLGDGCQRAVQFPKSPERDNLPRVIDFVQKHPVSPPLAAIG